MAAGLAALSVVLGAILACQAPINAALGAALGSRLAALLVSLLVSTACAVVLQLGFGGTPEWRAAPLWSYILGGLIGATFVGGALLLVPRLGAASFLSCVVLGQLLAGLAIDHLGAFGLETRAATPTRIGGVALVLAGVALLRLR